MEKIEEIEDFYKKGIEKLDKEFLENLKKLKYENNKQLESVYKEKTKKLRYQYEKKYQNYLEYQKLKIKIEENKNRRTKIKKEKYKTLNVKKLNLNPTFKERLSDNWELYKFKQNINRKKFFNKITPNFLIYSRLRINFYLKNLSKDASRYLNKKSGNIIKTFIKIFEKFKEIAIKIFFNIKNSFIFLSKKISRKKESKEEKKESKENSEKSDEEKVA